MSLREILETIHISVPTSSWYTTTNLFPGHHARRCNVNRVRIVATTNVLVGLDATRDATQAIDATREAFYDAMSTDSSQFENSTTSQDAANRNGQVVATFVPANSESIFFYRPNSKVIIKNLDAAQAADVYLGFLWEGRARETIGT